MASSTVIISSESEDKLVVTQLKPTGSLETWSQLHLLLTCRLGMDGVQAQTALDGVLAALVYAESESRQKLVWSFQYLQQLVVQLAQAEGLRPSATERKRESRKRKASGSLSRGLRSSPVKHSVHYRNELIEFLVNRCGLAQNNLSIEASCRATGMILIALGLRRVPNDYASPNAPTAQADFFLEEFRKSYRAWNPMQLPGLRKGRYSSRAGKFFLGP